jgi:hypothetical protein
MFVQQRYGVGHAAAPLLPNRNAESAMRCSSHKNGLHPFVDPICDLLCEEGQRLHWRVLLLARMSANSSAFLVD